MDCNYNALNPVTVVIFTAISTALDIDYGKDMIVDVVKFRWLPCRSWKSMIYWSSLIKLCCPLDHSVESLASKYIAIDISRSFRLLPKARMDNLMDAMQSQMGSPTSFQHVTRNLSASTMCILSSVHNHFMAPRRHQTHTMYTPTWWEAPLLLQT